MSERARCGGGCGGAVAVGSGGVTVGTMGGGGGPTPEVDACAEDRGQCWACQVKQQDLNEGYMGRW